MALVTVTMGATALLMLTNAPALWVVLSLGFYMAFLAVSICGVIWVLIPEIFPNRLRGKGSSISTFVNWSTNAFSAFAFPWYISHYRGLGTGYFTFAAICLVATVFFWKLVPDKRKDAGGDREVLDGGVWCDDASGNFIYRRYQERGMKSHQEGSESHESQES